MIRPGASVVVFIENWMFGVILFFLALYLQNVLDLGPLAAGGVFLCIWPALWGRRRPVPAGEHPTTAHPLWSSLWRRRRVPAGSTPGA